MTEQGQWQVAGNAPEVYQQYLVPAIFEAWTPKLVALATLREGERVLDVACGTGVVARLAAEYVGPAGKVCAIDVNPGMIAFAHTLPRPSGAAIEWREADAGELPFGDSQFDAVFCQLGLDFFADKPRALEETHRVLTPGGRLALLVWRSIEHSPGFETLANALAHHVSAEAAAIMRAPFVFGDNGNDLRTLIAGAGFGEVTIQGDVGTVRFPTPEDLVRHYVSGSPLAGHVAQVAEDTRTMLINEVSLALQPYLNDQGLAFPIEGHLVVAIK